MTVVEHFVDLFLHLDQYLGMITEQYGMLSYLFVFLILFCETGLVVTPFLPGDSLLFAVGALSALGVFHVGYFFVLLCIAAILGDTVNYHIGFLLRHKVEQKEDMRFIKRQYLEKTQAFFERHGGKTLVIARFIPIVRSFAPFVSGVGKMRYSRFLAYNVVGGILWVTVALFAGYFFGNIRYVKENFSLVVIGIVLVSALPAFIAYVQECRLAKTAAACYNENQENREDGGLRK